MIECGLLCKIQRSGPPKHFHIVVLKESTAPCMIGLLEMQVSCESGVSVLVQNESGTEGRID
jgi:hypothetical protein